MSTRAAARMALAEGWVIVPIPRGSKNPGFHGWEKVRLTEADVDASFADDGNIGVILGEPSGNLRDVDLDCPEAIALADFFLPQTDREHGRVGAPRSHRWCVADEPGPTVQYKDPDTKKMMVELRGDGGQTVIPPSIHDSGVPYEWDKNGQPAKVKLKELTRAVKQLAAATLIARRYPTGNRHGFTLALAGFLLRRGLEADEVEDLILTVARSIPGAARPEDVAHIKRNVEDTAAKLADGKAVTGGTTLAEFMSEKTISKLVEWLELPDETRYAKGAREKDQDDEDAEESAEPVAFRDPWEVLEQAGTANRRRYSTGLPHLDALMRADKDGVKGVQTGTMFVINAAPGSRKTTFAEWLGWRFSKHHGFAVGALMADEGDEAAAVKVGQMVGGDRALLEAGDPTAIAELRAKLAGKTLRFMNADDPRASIERLAGRLREEAPEGPRILIYDTLHTVRSDHEPDRAETRKIIESRVHALTREVRQHRDTLAIVVSEVNRATYAGRAEDSSRNPLAAGAESRSIEFGASIQMMLETRADTSLIKVIVSKNRQGERGEFALRINPVDLSFTSCPATEYEDEVQKEKDAAKEDRLEAARQRVLEFVGAHPGCSTRKIGDGARGAKKDNTAALEDLVGRGAVRAGPRGGKGGGTAHFLPKDLPLEVRLVESGLGARVAHVELSQPSRTVPEETPGR